MLTIGFNLFCLLSIFNGLWNVSHSEIRFEINWIDYLCFQKYVCTKWV